MNIFVLDECPKKAAEYSCDKHVVKMILESAQLLSTALRQNGVHTTYKATHVNHPCSIWARKTKGNYQWLYNHFISLLAEYTKRYNKVHACQRLTQELHPNNFKNENQTLTSFSLAMPENYKSEDPVKSYRSYYLGEKYTFAKWKLGNEPEWWVK